MPRMLKPLCATICLLHGTDAFAPALIPSAVLSEGHCWWQHQRPTTSIIPRPFSPHDAPSSICHHGRAAASRALSPTAQAVASAVGHAIGGSLAVPVVAGATGTWYRRIPLPSWTPPDRVFGPVWTVLYSCMGVAAARVVRRLAAGGAAGAVWRSPAVALWAAHCALNLAWAPVFFGLKRLRLGLWINYLLLGTLAAVIPLFAANDLASALLLVPYAAWLIYATALNQAICKLNPTDASGYNEARFQDDLIKLQNEAATYAGV